MIQALVLALLAIGFFFVVTWLIIDPSECDCPACQFLRAERSQRTLGHFLHSIEKERQEVNWSREGF